MSVKNSKFVRGYGTYGASIMIREYIWQFGHDATRHLGFDIPEDPRQQAVEAMLFEMAEALDKLLSDEEG